MYKILATGLDWLLESLSSKIKLQDIYKVIEFGNHKDATENPDLLRQLVKKDITHGYRLVLPPSKISHIL